MDLFSRTIPYLFKIFVDTSKKEFELVNKKANVI